MTNDPKNPEPGEFQIDASPVSAFAAYLKEGELQGKRREQPGIEDAFREVFSNHAELGARAGVTEEDIRALQASNERIEMVRKYLGPTRKLLGILEDTEGEEDDKRHRILNAIANAVDRRSAVRGNEELAARYSKTREYRSAIAVKAVRTRRRNQAAADAGEPTSGKRSSSRRRVKAKAEAVASAQPVPSVQSLATVPTPNSGAGQA
jgi:hypothetical protein